MAVKITRAHLGKYAEIVWRDPGSRRVKLREVPRGWDALATWKERGVIADITDGIVRIDHSEGQDPPHDSDQEPEIYATWTHEALIESVTILEPVVQRPEPRSQDPS